MSSKYENDVWELLSFEKIQSTKELTDALQKKVKKVINWYTCYKILKGFEEDHKVKRFEIKGGIFWIKK